MRKDGAGHHEIALPLELVEDVPASRPTAKKQLEPRDPEYYEPYKLNVSLRTLEAQRRYVVLQTDQCQNPSATVETSDDSPHRVVLGGASD